MTVAELIEELKVRDPKDTVYFTLSSSMRLTVFASYVEEPGTIKIELGEE